ncbi:hypothetical protein F5H01DRAFT_316553 [Linnemannia elongata]|nr:hypothetical protein F5H01DRAFT_316553 [Linnemannia elongata]
MRKNARERVVEGNLIGDSYFTIRTEEHRRSTKLRAKTYPWKSLVVITDLGGYTIAEDNLQSFAEYLDTLWDTYASGRYTPFQYALFSGGCVFSVTSNASDVILRLTDKLDEYDESFVISRVIIRLKKGRTSRPLDQGLAAEYGEGIPRSLGNGFWALYLTKSRTKCILHAYVSWRFYRSVSLDDVIMGDFTEYYKLKDRCSPHLPVGLLSIADIQEFSFLFFDTIILIDLCRLIVMSMSTQSQTAGEQKYKRKVQRSKLPTVGGGYA